MEKIRTHREELKLADLPGEQLMAAEGRRRCCANCLGCAGTKTPSPHSDVCEEWKLGEVEAIHAELGGSYGRARGRDWREASSLRWAEARRRYAAGYRVKLPEDPAVAAAEEEKRLEGFVNIDPLAWMR